MQKYYSRRRQRGGSMRTAAVIAAILLLPGAASAQFRTVGRAVKKAAVYVYTHPPGEHDWESGVDRIPLHLAAFGGPAFVAEHYMPERWAITTAVGIGIWRAWAEHRDLRLELDTKAKAWIDWTSQVTGGVVGATAWRKKEGK